MNLSTRRGGGRRRAGLSLVFALSACLSGATARQPSSIDNLITQGIEEIHAALSDGALWEGFDLRGDVIIIRSFHQRAVKARCLGDCPARLAETRSILSIPSAPRNSHDVGSAFAPGSLAGKDTQILVVDVGPRLTNARCIAATAVHEAFHLYYQGSRDAAIPMEFSATPGETLPASYQRLGSRRYLEEVYASQEEVRTAIRVEIEQLAAAVRFARRQDLQNARDAITQFVAIRDRRRSTMTVVNDEDLWEIREGIPSFLESRLSRRFARFGEPCSLLEYIIGGGSWDPFSTRSYFLVSGGLQAALLDELHPLWPTEVFTGKTGDGRPLYSIVRRLAAKG